jgi:hypothetical protein
MAVQLFDLVDPLKRQVNPPGTDLFPSATDDDFLGSLTNAFWEIRLYGMLATWEENAAARGGPDAFGEAIVTPIGEMDETYDDPEGWAPEDLPRDLQQLIVVWAGYQIVLTRLSALNTVFRAKAGPVEYETQNAASVLKGVLDQLKARLDDILSQLSGAGHPGVFGLDAVVERTYSMAMGDTWWVGA